jgi:hypothetical protein
MPCEQQRFPRIPILNSIAPLNLKLHFVLRNSDFGGRKWSDYLYSFCCLTQSASLWQKEIYPAVPAPGLQATNFLDKKKTKSAQNNHWQKEPSKVTLSLAGRPAFGPPIKTE